MNNKITFTICLAATLLMSAQAVAAPVFDLRDVAGSAGEALEDGFTFSDGGLTISVAVATTLGDGTGEYRANASQGGVDSDGVTSGGGDAASELDAGETLTFTLSYDPGTASASLTFVDLQGVDDASDSATVNINGSLTTLSVAIPGVFNISTDVWTTGGISIPDGSTIILTTNDRIGIQELTFNVVSVIPEPSSAGLACLGVFGWIARRRRS